jgi:serine/threonine protein kinase
LGHASKHPGPGLAQERDGFPMTSIREINILLTFDHPNVVSVSEVVMGRESDAIYMVMEWMDHDLKGLMDGYRKCAARGGFCLRLSVCSCGWHAQ